jgi:hypothetical protein
MFYSIENCIYEYNFLSFFNLPFYCCTVHLISSKSVIYQQMHFISVLENIKIFIKTYIKISPTCFGLRPSSGSLHISLVKVTCIKPLNAELNPICHLLALLGGATIVVFSRLRVKSVKVRRYGLCGCVCAVCCAEFHLI